MRIAIWIGMILPLLSPSGLGASGASKGADASRGAVRYARSEPVPFTLPVEAEKYQEMLDAMPSMYLHLDKERTLQRLLTLFQRYDFEFEDTTAEEAAERIFTEIIEPPISLRVEKFNDGFNRQIDEGDSISVGLLLFPGLASSMETSARVICSVTFFGRYRHPAEGEEEGEGEWMWDARPMLAGTTSFHRSINLKLDEEFEVEMDQYGGLRKKGSNVLRLHITATGEVRLEQKLNLRVERRLIDGPEAVIRFRPRAEIEAVKRASINMQFFRLEGEEHYFEMHRIEHPAAMEIPMEFEEGEGD